MVCNTQGDPSFMEHWDLIPIHKSFTSNAVICLLLLLLALTGCLLASAQRTRRSLLPLSASGPGPTGSMSTLKEDEFPPPTPESVPIDPELPDPLGYVYYPITSAQLVALADKKTMEAEEKRARGEKPDSPDSTEDLSQFGDRLTAYIRYFEDRENQETWQRRVVHYDTSHQTAT